MLETLLEHPAIKGPEKEAPIREILSEIELMADLFPARDVNGLIEALRNQLFEMRQLVLELSMLEEDEQPNAELTSDAQKILQDITKIKEEADALGAKELVQRVETAITHLKGHFDFEE
jgi:hypothetical protein